MTTNQLSVSNLLRKSIRYGRLLKSQLTRLRGCAAAIAVLLVVSGCGPSILNPTVPFGFDISGNWILIEQGSDESPDVKEIERRETTKVLRGKDFDPVGSLAFAVQDFPVLISNELKIEQDEQSMGISYSNGTYQDLVWGKRKRGGGILNVGWSGDVLVVSSTRKRIEGFQEWRLEEDDTSLSVRVFVKTAKDKLDVTRKFKRQ